MDWRQCGVSWLVSSDTRREAVARFHTNPKSQRLCGQPASLQYLSVAGYGLGIAPRISSRNGAKGAQTRSKHIRHIAAARHARKGAWLQYGASVGSAIPCLAVQIAFAPQS